MRSRAEEALRERLDDTATADPSWLPPSPRTLMTIVYGVVMPEGVGYALEAIERARLDPPAMRRPGFVYVLRDARDEPSLVKIGSTSRPDVERRLAEHRRALGDRQGRYVGIVFAVATRRPRTLEATAHVLLECAHQPMLFNSVTRTRATEYFLLSNLSRLELLLRALARRL